MPMTVKGSWLISIVLPMGSSPSNRESAVPMSMIATERNAVKSLSTKLRPSFRTRPFVEK